MLKLSSSVTFSMPFSVVSFRLRTFISSLLPMLKLANALLRSAGVP